MAKSIKQTKRVKPKKDNKQLLAGIMGLLQLFVVASIVYTTAIILMGSEGLVPKVLTIPQSVYAAVVVFKRFVK